MSDVTRVLHAIESGDARAADQLLPLVYEELCKLAARKMANEARGHTLQPTALVHEAWLRLAGSEQHTWQNRAHFFGAAAEAMRRILIDSARCKRAQRHGGGRQRVDVEEVEIAFVAEDDQLLAVHDARQVRCAGQTKSGTGETALFCRNDDRRSRATPRRFRADGETLVGLLARLAASGGQKNPERRDSQSECASPTPRE